MQHVRRRIPLGEGRVAVFRRLREQQFRRIQELDKRIASIKEKANINSGNYEHQDHNAQINNGANAKGFKNIAVIRSDDFLASHKHDVSPNYKNLPFLSRAELGIKERIEKPFIEHPEEIGTAIFALQM
ncbi:MAG: hypothetical protein QW165_00635 [Candidatus Woesearchaeota archaeon]